MERNELEQIYNAELSYVRDNEEYFVRTYGHIENKDSAEVIIKFAIWKAQIELLQHLQTDRRVLVLKARQLGISWLVLHHLTWTLLHAGKTAIGLSENEDKAKELVRRMSQVILKYMPALVKEKGNIPKGWHGIWYESTALSVTIHFPDGAPDSRFECFPSSQSAGRSFTADILFFDEWAFQQFDRDIWGAAYPTINRPNSGQVIGVSTIKRGSLFEELYTNEQNSFYKAFIPWYADPTRTQAWYEETKANLGDPALMTAEYPASVEEALTVPGGAFFPEVTDSSINTNMPLIGSIVTYFFMDYGLDKLAAYWVNRDAFGNSQIVHEHYESDLTIGAASEIITDTTAALLVRGIIQPVSLYLAPPDLWNRDQMTGKSRAVLFYECGLNLTKVNNDFAAGTAAMKEQLRHADGKTSRLTILANCAPNLYRSLTKIQRDKKNPNIYAKDPHELTHACDALRYYCIYWTSNAMTMFNQKHIKWRPDMYEDYENANEQDRATLIEMWGEPN